MDEITIFINDNLPLLSLIVGWFLDMIFGDPVSLPHPVVYMGKWIAKGEKHLNKGKYRKAKGGVFAVVSICAIFVIAHFSLALLNGIANNSEKPSLPLVVLSLAIQSVLVFYCLAGKTLRHEVQMVFEALQCGLREGRKQVSRIVGRDTQTLSRQEVATASLETLAENLSDGVVAPLFWFCLLGMPGMLTYKMVNTLDSMIGYQNKRYKDFGCWAAHIDDIANYIPARITAILVTVCGWVYVHFYKALPHRSLSYYASRTWHYSRCHASPNSGWPEAALSALLDCRFGGPHDYFGELFYKPYIGTNPRELTTSDMQFSIRLCFIVETLSVMAISAVLYLVSMYS